MLYQQVLSGHIQGLRLSRGAPIITDLLYADDLLLFGTATHYEVGNILTVLDSFCRISDQCVSPPKSKLWFNSSTPTRLVDQLCVSLGAQLASPEEQYLGCQVRTTKRANFQYIIDKIDARLQGWMTKILSLASKLIIIKSVIESTLLFYMTTTFFPLTVLQDILSKLSFSFGVVLTKLDTSLTALGRWLLGLRDIFLLNQALILKLLWKRASRSNSLWIQIIRAKYLSRTTVWNSTVPTSGSSL